MPSRILDHDRPVFRARLTPHRSLDRRGFAALMGVFGFVSLAIGLTFYAIGAWPVLGFLGLDVALLYVALSLNTRAADEVETIELSALTLAIERVRRSVVTGRWHFSPAWARVELSEQRGGTAELSVSARGDRVVLGAFLSDPERRDFAAALRHALASSRPRWI